jgi:hypothetical protein
MFHLYFYKSKATVPLRLNLEDTLGFNSFRLCENPLLLSIHSVGQKLEILRAPLTHKQEEQSH